MKLRHFTAMVVASAAAFGAGAVWNGHEAPSLGGFDAGPAQASAPAEPVAPPAPAERVSQEVQSGSTIDVNGTSISVVGGGSVTVSYSGEAAVVTMGAQPVYAQAVEEDDEDVEEEVEEEAPAQPCPPPKAPTQSQVKSKLAAQAKAKAAPANQASVPAQASVAGAAASLAWAAGGAVEASAPGAFEKEIASGEPTLVIFYAVWCGYCKAYLPKAKEWANAHGVKLALVDAERRKDLASEAKVRGYPSTLAYKDGKPWTPISSGNLQASGLAAYAAKRARFPGKDDAPKLTQATAPVEDAAPEDAARKPAM